MLVSSNTFEGMVGQSIIIDWKALLLTTIIWKVLVASQPNSIGKCGWSAAIIWKVSLGSQQVWIGGAVGQQPWLVS